MDLQQILKEKIDEWCSRAGITVCTLGARTGGLNARLVNYYNGKNPIRTDSWERVWRFLEENDPDEYRAARWQGKRKRKDPEGERQ